MARSGSVCQGLAFNFKQIRRGTVWYCEVRFDSAELFFQNYRGGAGSGSALYGKVAFGMVGLFLKTIKAGFGRVRLSKVRLLFFKQLRTARCGSARQCTARLFFQKHQSKV